MNVVTTVAAERSWPRHRWALFIGMAFVAHIGLIFAFGDRKPITPRAMINAPVLQFASHRTDREQLDDPTLFALPHPNGFAGAAWMRRSLLTFAPFRWTEPPRLLALSGTQLGETFLKRRETNRFARIDLELETLPPPEVTQHPALDVSAAANRRSRVSLGGELAHRHWLNAPTDLPGLRAADLLTNTVVQVWVEAGGRVFSPALLLPGSGSKEADQLALKTARAARFAPLTDAAAPLTRGTLVFEWQSMPQTNAPLVTP